MTIKSLLLLVLFSSGLLNAQAIPGRWEKVDSLPANTQLTITLKSGDTTNYIFDNSDSTVLTVHSRGGAQLRIPKGDVAEIVQHKPRSNKPSLIWAAVGGGLGAGIGAAIGYEAEEVLTPEGTALVLGLTGALAGALIGYYTTDKPPDEVLYQAP